TELTDNRIELAAEVGGMQPRIRWLVPLRTEQPRQEHVVRHASLRLRSVSLMVEIREHRTQEGPLLGMHLRLFDRDRALRQARRGVLHAEQWPFLGSVFTYLDHQRHG